MAEDVLEDLVVAAETAALESGFRSQPVQLGGLQELRVLRRLQQLLRINVPAQRRAGLHVDDACIDRVAAETARHGNTMMPVDHVIAVADFVDVDRRQLAAFDHGGVHARPSIAKPPRSRKETREEIARFRRRSGRADYLVDGNLPDAAERPSLRARSVEDGFQRYQPAGPARQRVADRPPKSAEARGIEVFTGAYLFHTRYLQERGFGLGVE